MSQLFDKIRVGSTKRSTFDLSHKQITSSDFGYLVPICFRDMVPNDDFVVSPQVFCRAAQMVTPAFADIRCSLHHFFVPYRILYGKWDAFITQDKSNHTVPPYSTVGYMRTLIEQDPAFGSDHTLPRGYYTRLMSNLGINPSLLFGDTLPLSERISMFPFLAYYRIWLDWFADTSLVDHSVLDAAFKDDIENGGEINKALYFLTKCRCFKKDYFTTAKVHPQDGNPSVVGVDIASQEINPSLFNAAAAKQPLRFDPVSGNFYPAVSNNSLPTAGSTSKIGQFTVEALRAANSLQRYLERNNFVGTKIINRILAHFGVSPTPERLDMAEFIGGSSFPIRIGDVTSTNSIDGTTQGLGLQGGKALGAHSPESVRYHAKEHGIFMTLMSILPDTSYYQGISRMWQKGVNGDALDFFHPEFENLGYQEVLNKELYIPNDVEAASYLSYAPDGVFGYVPRYSEYKFHQDILAGDFVASYQSASVFGSSADSWHLFRHLAYDDENPLALNSNFTECNNINTDYDRIFQYTNNQFDHFYFSVFNDVKATRPMDGFTAPSLDTNNSGDGNSIELPYGGTRL